MSLHAYLQKSVATMQPAIPNEIAHKEMENYKMVPNQVQIVKMVDKDGKEVKRVCLILIKREIHRERGHQIALTPSELPTGMPVLDPHEAIVKREVDDPYESYDEVVTDDPDYQRDDIPLPTEPDSSAAESMESDTEYQEVDIAAIEKAMEKVTTGLRMVATGYEELRPVMRAMPIHEVPKLLEQLPQLILDLIPETIRKVVQHVDNTDLVKWAVQSEHHKGTLKTHIQRKFGLGRDAVEKCITGKGHLGGSTYSRMKKEDPSSVPTQKVKKER